MKFMFEHASTLLQSHYSDVLYKKLIHYSTEARTWTITKTKTHITLKLGDEEVTMSYKLIKFQESAI